VIGVRRGADPDLVVRLPDGTHAAVAMSLTDFAGAGAHTPPGEPLPLLDIHGLRRIAQWLCQDGRAGR
jgi:hypothetical protein